MKKLITITLTALLALSSCMEKDMTAATTEGESETMFSTIFRKKAEYTKITPEKAYEMMNSGDAYILLDVRTKEEYDEGHINGSLLIPDYEIKDKAETALSDKDAVILVYCRSGRRSAGAAERLASMGYTNIYDMGGIINWPYGTVGG